MIYTLTLNPAIDYFVTLNNDLLIDEVNRGSNELFKAGGKGLNVSKILSVLNIRSSAIALLGGFTGKYIEDCFSNDTNVTVIPIRVDGMNRINVKAHYNHKALCINGAGPTADQNTKEVLLSYLEMIAEEDAVIISGSMMKGLDDSFLVELSEEVHKKNAKLVIDMEQVTAEVLIKCRPFLIKPNLYEFQLIMGDESINADNIKSSLLKASEFGIENVLVSMGARGAALCTKRKTYYLNQPHTPLINKVGAGDAMLAAFVGKLLEGSTEEEALCYGGASGNAVASKLKDITLEDIQKYLSLMSVSETGD